MSFPNSFKTLHLFTVLRGKVQRAWRREIGRAAQFKTALHYISIEFNGSAPRRRLQCTFYKYSKSSIITKCNSGSNYSQIKN